MLSIKDSPHKSQNNSNFALFEVPFRVFFLGAVSFALLAMIIWMCSYSFAVTLQFSRFTSVMWHAHEMVFGYSVAVIAGFLLTAIKNWTTVATINGKALLVLFLIWVLARVLPFTTQAGSEFTGFFDITFSIVLIVAVIRPVLQVKQFKQSGIILIVILLLMSNILYYLGVYQVINKAMNFGIYSGLYLVMLLIFIMARRVLPFFIEKGVDKPLQLKNYPYIDVSSLVLFVMYCLFDILSLHQNSLSVLALLLFIVHSIRLAGWYSHEIWKKPLLWSLFVGYGFLVLGFAIKFLEITYGLLPFLALHSFAVGGIGLITLSMMSRVALGHTGRNVFEPPKSVFWIFVLLLSGAISRVLMPIFIPDSVRLWLLMSQFFWIAAFSLYLIGYFSILIRPDVNGK